LNYAVTLALPNLGKKGNLAGIIVGAEPYLTDIDVPGTSEVNEDVPLHVEGFYKYQLTDNISVTPGVIWLTAPNQNNNNSDVVIGTVRTTFTF
jgi:carbohydrate-selective porin OprB